MIKSAYLSFNERKIDDVLALMHADVDWPNGWEGGYVHGHNEIKEYWTRQWKEIDPEVVPFDFLPAGKDAIKVAVRQKVKSLSGDILMDKNIFHTYFFKEGLISRMEIDEYSDFPR